MHCSSLARNKCSLVGEVVNKFISAIYLVKKLTCSRVEFSSLKKYLCVEVEEIVIVANGSSEMVN